MPQRQASTRTNTSTASKFSNPQQETQDQEQSQRNPPPSAERRGWVDEDYIEENPWYGESHNKAVFSLGRPLPHTSRSRKKKTNAKQTNKTNKTKARKDDADLERGPSQTQSQRPPRKKSVRIADESSGADAAPEQHERGSTEAGKAHSSRRNSAGQPVYDYQPRRSDSRSETEGEEYIRDEEGRKYKVDGEPIGQDEDDAVEEGKKDPNEFRNWWARVRAKYPEPCAEFLAVSLTTY